MTEEKKTLKETLEIVKAVELVAVKGFEIAKNGVGAEDIAPAIELLKEVNTLIEGIKGAPEAVEELKELDEQELIQLGLALFTVYKKVKEASKEIA